MKKIFLLITLLFATSSLTLGNHSNIYPSSAYIETEPERLMTLFLKAVQSNNAVEVKKFINENYSSKFLGLPIEVHLKVIADMHKDFSRHIVMQKTSNGNKTIVLIKSPVNKMRQITLETDGRQPAKIFIIDIKEPTLK